MKKSVVSFIAVLLLICFLGVTAVTGVYIPGGWTMPFRNAETTQSDSADTQTDAASDSTDTSAETTTGSADAAESADTTAAPSRKAIIPSVLDNENGIRLGLDLVGGSRIVYEAEIPDGYNQANLADDMNSVQKVIRQRLTDKGFTEATVTLTGENRVTVEIPQITNPEEAVQTLGTTAQLTFIDADGKEWLTGSDIKKATYGYGRPTGNEVTDVHYVQVQFTSEGQKKFAEATGNIAARTDGTNIMAIVMDNQVISSPSVSSQIDSDSCVISGSFTRDSASELADLINAGQIPFSLKQVELRSVGPQLGADAMRTSLIAGLIGIALVMLFMLIVYRIPGLVASIALCFYMVIEALIFSLVRVNLSLPGIAGIILSIGMAVDANVIIFTRIKEEIGAGKAVKTAIDNGFQKALSAIVDGNVTTLIAAAVLFWRGSGTVKGFASTLAIGIVLSMFTALFVTRFALNALYSLGIENAKFYGIKKETAPKPFLKYRKFCFVLSAAAVAAGFVFMGMNRSSTGQILNYSMEFKGGTSTNVTFNEEMSQERIESEVVPLVEEITKDADVQTQRVTGTNEVIIKTRTLNVEERQAFEKAMQENFGVEEGKIAAESISGAVSQEMKRDAMAAVIIATIGMLLYIWLRFKNIRFAGSSVLALVHDVLVVLACYAAFKWSVGSTFIACMLTIVGYSINATIVIFDRIRENMKERRRDQSLEEVVNLSITQTFTRSINTSLTTFIMVLALYIMGVSSIREFALPLMVGIVCGTYSSVCLTGAMWYEMSRRKEKNGI